MGDGQTRLSGAPIPVHEEAPDMPDALAEYAEFVDDHLAVLTATDEADRDARYLDAVGPGKLVTGTGNRLWLRDDQNQWRTVHEQRGPATTGVIDMAANWTNEGSRALMRNGIVYLHLNVRYTGVEAIAAGNGGHLPSRPAVGNLGVNWRTNYGWVAPYSFATAGGTCEIYPSGNLVLTNVYPNNVISPNQLIRCNTSYPLEW